MTNSYRKPFHSTVCYSPLGMRQYKRIRARRERARVLTAINSGRFDVGYELAPWDDWECPLDGKKRYEPDDVKWSRK